MPALIDYDALGKRIREYRIASGYSQRALSERLHRSDSFVQHLENGRYHPTLEVLIELCCALNVSCNTLLADSLPEDMFGEAPDRPHARFRQAPGALRNTLTNWVNVDRPDESLPDAKSSLPQPVDLEKLPPLGFVGLNEPMPENRFLLPCERYADGSRSFRKERTVRKR